MLNAIHVLAAGRIPPALVDHTGRTGPARVRVGAHAEGQVATQRELRVIGLNEAVEAQPGVLHQQRGTRLGRRRWP